MNLQFQNTNSLKVTAMKKHLQQFKKCGKTKFSSKKTHTKTPNGIHI